MGGWIMLHVAQQRKARIAALVGIAAAPDFTKDLMWDKMTPDQQQTLIRDGVLTQENHYSPDPYIITRALIEDGRKHLLLEQPINITCPVRLLHGMADRDVPWQVSVRLSEQLQSQDVELHLIKTGDHRLSLARDVAALWSILARFYLV